MAYDKSDPRRQLGGPVNPGANLAPQYFEFAKRDPSEQTVAGSKLWWARSQAIVSNYIEAAADDVLSLADQRDEYVILLPSPDTRALLQAGSETVEVVGRTLVIMPPGPSSITVATDIALLRLFSSESPELCARCDNNDVYDGPDPNVTPFEAWPDPPDGFRIRPYSLDDFPQDKERFGRLFRCTTLMINYFYPVGPRDPSVLSPHHHDDFEQLSLQVTGDYIHHIRTPWTVNMADWREDEHQFCTAPSITVIPPPSVHTSQAVGDHDHILVDIFAPPRADFSARPGWVLNADEYPAPASASATVS